MRKFVQIFWRWNLATRLIRNAEFDDDVRFFCYEPKIPCLGKFVPKNQNCLFEMKLGAQTNWNMLNLMVKFKFCLLNWKIPFWRNLVQKGKNTWLRWNLMLRLGQIWPVSDQKYTFQGKVGPKIIIVCFRWIMVPRLNGICWIRWLCSYNLFWTGNTFLGKFGLKNYICSRWNLVPNLIRICGVRW